jgi:glutamyl-tRNA reductase
MAVQVGGEAYPYEDLAAGIADVDVVFLSTAASQPILHTELIAEVMAHRPLRPLVLVDLSVPRNVERKVRENWS